jgi:hypothetical protein
MGLLFTIAAGIASAVILHIVVSQSRDNPNLEGQVPVFISPRSRIAQLYPQVLGSIFVASYGS